MLVVGIDTGGTFTDIVYRDGAHLGVYKILSTPDDPSRAVLEGLRAIAGGRRAASITYGTTVATNAMLERRGARTSVLLTSGFEDLLSIGRQSRKDLYDLEPVAHVSLAERAACIGVRERCRFDGTVALELTDEEVRRVRKLVKKSRAESIAICLIHSYARPLHERTLARSLRDLGVPVTASSDIAPIRGEYERASTATANAYVLPRVAGHLQALARRVSARTLRVMQSNGGGIGVRLASREPVRTMLSGPAGGVAAATEATTAAGFTRAISLDMGGTSTDVALINEVPLRRATTEVGGVPIAVPSLDIHTVGAGGGSIARVDAGGALRVGPESAGAIPGPACYGRGKLPTVTDANAVLGRLRPEAFLGGCMQIDVDRARGVLSRLARRMGVGSENEAAEGVIRVVENNMERAIRVMTVERGQDPRACVLVPFGGAAGLHACGLADALDIRSILVPPDPGVFSARGMLAAPFVHDVTRTVAKTKPTFSMLRTIADRLEREVRRVLASEGIPRQQIRVSRSAQLRFSGEGSSLEVPLTRPFAAEFLREHSERFRVTGGGTRTIECTAIRVSGSAAIHDGNVSSRPHLGRRSALVADRVPVWIDGKSRRLSCFDRSSLPASITLRGPALVTEYSSTLLIAPGWTLRRLKHGELLLER